MRPFASTIHTNVVSHSITLFLRSYCIRVIHVNIFATIIRLYYAFGYMEQRYTSVVLYTSEKLTLLTIIEKEEGRIHV